MPEVTIKIGDRSFEVACQEGEEHFLQSAAAMLDVEAQTLASQIRHLTESRMLLMAGLMVADKTAGIDDNLKIAEARIVELEAKLAEAEANAGTVAVAAPGDTAALEALSGLASQLEGLAARIEDKAAE